MPRGSTETALEFKNNDATFRPEPFVPEFAKADDAIPLTLSSGRSISSPTSMAAKRAPQKNVAETTATRPARGRPPRISSEKLLDVARDVFLERGIRATTLEVAERAGVSEGVIFHRFKSKEALFREAMHFDLDDLPKLMASAIDRIEALEIREALIQLATALLEIGRIGIPLVMMSWSNPDHREVCASGEKRADYEKIVNRLAAYFETKMNEGKLRRVDAEVFARTFMGAIHHYCMAQLVSAAFHTIPLPEGMFIRGLVDLLLQGAAPENEKDSPSSFRRLVRG